MDGSKQSRHVALSVSPSCGWLVARHPGHDPASSGHASSSRIAHARTSRLHVVRMTAVCRCCRCCSGCWFCCWCPECPLCGKSTAVMAASVLLSACCCSCCSCGGGGEDCCSVHTAALTASLSCEMLMQSSSGKSANSSCMAEDVPASKVFFAHGTR